MKRRCGQRSIPVGSVPYGPGMPWEEAFDDLDVHLAARREDERRAHEAEEDRQRIAQLVLRDRVRAVGGAVTVETEAGLVVGEVAGAGVGWVALRSSHELTLVRLDAVLTVTPATLSRSVLPMPEDELSARVTFGFASRALARSRIAVIVQRRDGATLGGTIDRAGADHLELAVHETDQPRRQENVRSVVWVPFAAIATMRVPEATRLPFG